MAKTKALTFHYKKVKTNDTNHLQDILNSLNHLTVEQKNLCTRQQKIYPKPYYRI